MRSSQGNVEMLCLLCCLVGLVAFFCISFAFSAAFREPPENESLLEEWKDLMHNREIKEKAFQDLARGVQELERRISDMEDPGDQKRIPGIRLKELELQMAKALRERDDLLERIRKLREELDWLPKNADPRSRKDLEDEIYAHAKRLQELEERIERAAREAERQGVDLRKKAGEAEDSAKRKSHVKARVEELRAQKKAVEEEINHLKVQTLSGGAGKFKKPLYVECRKDVYVFYPEGSAVGVSELEKKNVFQKRFSGHDIVVLFVRPDGFSSFGKAYGKVSTLNCAISYEPIEANLPLDFLKGRP